MGFPSPDAWRRMEPILDAALDLPPGRRGDFLAEVCGEDRQLKRAIGAVLSACDAGELRWTESVGAFARHVIDDLVRTPIPDGTDEGGAPHDPEGLAPGAWCGPYRVLGELGRGGMGVVYLARDPRLRRLVALKRLPEHRAHGRDAQERLVREARAASALDHPNVATIYEVAEDGDGRPYIAMAYYEGETLERRIARPMSRSEALEIVGAIADGLAAVHAEGIVHRDIKPRNVVLTSDGGVKILDFGLADGGDAAADRRCAAGTLAYMSPEQTRGETPSERSDVWSLGVVLFEMLTGRRPFDGHGRAELIESIRSGTAAALEDLAPDLPPPLIAVVDRCLEKDPRRRYASASVLAEDLRAAASMEARPSPRMAPSALRGWAAAAMLAILASAFIVRSGADGATGDEPAPTPLPVVIARIEARTGDSLLALSVGDLLRVSLGQSVAVDVADPATIARTLSRMDRPPGSALDVGLAREVARRAGAAAVVAGRLHRIGSTFGLEASIVEAESGREVVLDLEIAPDSSGLIGAVDRLARRLRARIGESASRLEASPPLEHVATSSLAALEKYSQAMRVRRRDVDRAIVLLREAVSLDTSFAMAYRWLGTQSRDPESLTRAFALRGRVTPRERYAIEGAYHQFVTQDRHRAVAAYRSLLDLDPDDWLGLWNLAVEHMNAGDPRGAEEIASRAIEAHPGLSYSFYEVAAAARLALGRPGDALESLEAAVEHFPDMRVRSLVRWAAARRRYGAAIRWAASVDTAEAPLMAASLDAIAGRRSRALARLEGTGDEAVWRHRDAGRRREEIITVGPMIQALAWNDAAGARSLLERVLDDHPPSTGETPLRYRLSLAQAFAVAGDPVRARRLLDDYDEQVEGGRIDLHGDRDLRHRVMGHIAFAEGRMDDAIDIYRSIDHGSCALCVLPYLGRALEEVGQSDSAIAVYDRYLDTPYWGRLELDRFHLAPTLERLAHLHADRGDRAEEGQRLTEWVALWTGADPLLQGRVEAARRRLVELGFAGEEADRLGTALEGSAAADLSGRRPASGRRRARSRTPAPPPPARPPARPSRPPRARS